MFEIGEQDICCLISTSPFSAEISLHLQAVQISLSATSQAEGAGRARLHHMFWLLSHNCKNSPSSVIFSKSSHNAACFLSRHLRILKLTVRNWLTENSDLVNYCIADINRSFLTVNFSIPSDINREWSIQDISGNRNWMTFISIN